MNENDLDQLAINTIRTLSIDAVQQAKSGHPGSVPVLGGEAPRRAVTGRSLFASYRAQFPELATEIEQMERRELPAGWDRNLPSFAADPKGIAGRDASGAVLSRDGRAIGMHTFGASAPLKELQKNFGFESSHVVAAAKELLGLRSH